jgi:hypothetical protein
VRAHHYSSRSFATRNAAPPPLIRQFVWLYCHSDSCWRGSIVRGAELLFRFSLYWHQHGTRNSLAILPQARTSAPHRPDPLGTQNRGGPFVCPRNYKSQRWRSENQVKAQEKYTLESLCAGCPKILILALFRLLTSYQCWCRTSHPSRTGVSDAFSLHQPHDPSPQ